MIKNRELYKKIGILLLILAFLTIIPTSFAIDSVSTDISASNEDISIDSADLSVSDSNQIIQGVDNSKDANLKASSIDDVGSGEIQTNLTDTAYSDIKSAMAGAGDTNDYTIYLGEGSFSGEGNTKVNISYKTIQFIGRGQDKTFIDGSNANWLFNISDSTVTFKDLSLINAYSTGNVSAVIQTDWTNLNIINCTVRDNKVELFDGSNSFSPIYFESARNRQQVLNITGSNFINNSFIAHNYTGQYSTLSKATDGGVLTLKGARAIIQDSLFKDTYANSENAGVTGGVIYVFTNGVYANITNCTFINATANRGGAIGSNYGGNMTIMDCHFINLTAETAGTGIYSNDYGSGFSYEAFVFLGANTFENCFLADGSIDNINVTGAHEVYINDNGRIYVKNTETIFGEDKNLTVSVKDNNGDPISTLLEMNITGPVNISQDYNLGPDGILDFSLKELPIGIYEALFTVKSDIYSISPVSVQIMVHANFTYALAFNPSNATLYEGESYIVNGTAIDDLGKKTNALDGLRVYICWVDINLSPHSTTGGGTIENGTYHFDISNLELLPSKEYEIEFQVQYKALEDDPYTTVQNGFFYANLINKLPDNYVNIDVIYVDAASGNDESGTGEESNPLESIQVALNLNGVLGGGKTIVLRKGNYTVSGFSIKDDVTIIGEDASNVIVTQANGKNGMFMINEGLNVEFNNISFTKGYTTVVPYGAVFSNYYNSRLVLNNSIFYNNSGMYGGVVYNNDIDGTLIVDNCDFHDNNAFYAGAISASDGKINIHNSSFQGNYAQYRFGENGTRNGTGGAINVYGTTDVYIENCSFINNSAPGRELTYGGAGAIGISVNGTVEIVNSSFIDNYAGLYGGAIWAVHGTTDIIGCIFMNNSAKSEGSAIAAYYNDETVVNIRNSVIIADDDLNTHVVYAPDDTLSLVYANENWWGSNRAPNTINVNVSSSVKMTLYNDEEDNVVAALNTLSNGAEFKGYLPTREVIFTPADKFAQDRVNMTDGKVVMEYSGDIKTDVITATIDSQTLTLKYKHYPTVDTEIVTSNVSGAVNATVSIKANVTAGDIKLDAGNVSLYIDGTFIEMKAVENGQVNFDYISEQAGNYSIELAYSGDDTFKPSSASAQLTVVDLISTRLVSDEPYINVGENFTVRLEDANGDPLIGEDVSVQITSEEYSDEYVTKTADGGLVVFDLPAGEYDIEVTYASNDIYAGCNATIELAVSKYYTRFALSQDNDKVIFVLSSDGVLLENKTVKLTVISSSGALPASNLTTDKDGKVSISLNEGTYSVLANFYGDDFYLPTNISRQITVSLSNGTDDNGTNGTANGTDTNGTGNATDTNGTANGTDTNGTDPTNGTGDNGTGNGTNPDLKSTITSLTINPSVVALNGTVIITPSVTSEGNPIKGTVDILIGGVKISSVEIGSNYEYVPSNEGSFIFTARFAENDEYASSVSDGVALIVTAASDNGTDSNGTNPNGTEPTNGTDNNGTSPNGTEPTNGSDSNGTSPNGTSDDTKRLTGADIQKAIDNANPGDTVKLEDAVYENVSNIKITKDINLIGSENTSIISAGDGNPLFVISPTGAGVNDVSISDIKFSLNNGDTVVFATAENATNPIFIEIPKISISNNEFDSNNDNFVPESVNVLKLASERGFLNPTNEISISNNSISSGINPFLFDVTSVSNGTDVNVPVGQDYKEATVIEYKDMKTISVNANVDGRIGEYFQVNLTDANGNRLSNKFIQIGFNGKIYNRTTDENGSAKLQINLMYTGYYTFAVCFLGDEKYNASFIVAKINVTSQKAKLTTQAKTYKASAKTKSISATLKSASGNAIANKKITFTVNGKTYAGKTNSKGIASVNVSLSKKGTYGFTVKFAGDSAYAALSTKGTLKIK